MGFYALSGGIASVGIMIICAWADIKKIPPPFWNWRILFSVAVCHLAYFVVAFNGASL
jgi:hypothetical protein